jgi:hypothetical protein
VDILETLIAKLFLVDSLPGALTPPEAASLPAKDVPILLAAMEAGAAHLLTVDKKHFGVLYGKAVAQTLVLTPGAYLRSRRNT